MIMILVYHHHHHLCVSKLILLLRPNLSVLLTCSLSLSTSLKFLCLASQASSSRHLTHLDFSLSLSVYWRLSSAAEADGETTKSERVSESTRTADPDRQAVRDCGSREIKGGEPSGEKKKKGWRRRKERRERGRVCGACDGWAGAQVWRRDQIKSLSRQQWTRDKVITFASLFTPPSSPSLLSPSLSLYLSQRESPSSLSTAGSRSSPGSDVKIHFSPAPCEPVKCVTRFDRFSHLQGDWRSETDIWRSNFFFKKCTLIITHISVDLNFCVFHASYLQSGHKFLERNVPAQWLHKWVGSWND